jgi:hypothetical protein
LKEKKTGPSGNRKSIPLEYPVLFLLILPAAIWVFMDKSLWKYDPLQYGALSIELYSRLIRDPSRWLADLFTKFPIKAPMISWIGQFFVPLGSLSGNISVGLRLSTVGVQFMALLLTYKAFKKIFPRKVLAIIGCLVIAGAPLSIGLSTKFWVEPLQLLAVAWFIHIAVFAPDRDGLHTLLHLMAASSFAMLVKVSSPLYCLGPGLAALWYAVRERPAGLRWKFRSHMAVTAAALVLVPAAIVWYVKNLPKVLDFLQKYSLHDTAWGVDQSFIRKLVYWFGAFEWLFFLPFVLLIMIPLLLAATWVFIKKGGGTKGESLIVLMALFQVFLIVAVFSVFTNQDKRYLLPMLPYLAIIICWCAARLDRGWLYGALVLIFSFQFLAASLQAFGVTGKNNLFKGADMYTLKIWPPDNRGEELEMVEQIVDIVCPKNRRWQENVVGFGRPVATEQVLDFYALNRLAPEQVGCRFTYTLNFLWGAPPGDPTEIIWEKILHLKPAYYVDTEPGTYEIPNFMRKDPKRMGEYQVTLEILHRVQNSPKFRRVPMPGQPNIHIYEYVREGWWSRSRSGLAPARPGGKESPGGRKKRQRPRQRPDPP